MTILKPFPQFSLLPPELRLLIYSYMTLSPRTIELEYSHPSQTWVPIYYSPSNTIPLLLHLSSESRAYALTRYHYIFSLNIWLDPCQDTIYLRLAPGQIAAMGTSAWLFKLWDLMRSSNMDRLRYLVVGEEAWAVLREDSEVVGRLTEVGVVAKEERFPIWPENEIVISADKRVRRDENEKEKELKSESRDVEGRNRKKGPVIKYVHITRRFKGVLLGGGKDGASQSTIKEAQESPNL
ncbi:hypothetical protein ACMFMG_007036 [Clarireedia jacksonii]